MVSIACRVAAVSPLQCVSVVCGSALVLTLPSLVIPCVVVILSSRSCSCSSVVQVLRLSVIDHFTVHDRSQLRFLADTATELLDLWALGGQVEQPGMDVD